MSELIYFDEEAQSYLKSGVEKLCKAVSITMGPRGKLVLIERNGIPPHLTKDGATVAKNVVLTDPIESLGAQLLKQASENTATIAGDGSTTSAVLAKEIYFKSSQALQTGIASPSEICKILNEKCDEVIDFLNKKARSVESSEEVKQVATISANGDEYIGDLISNAMIEVGSSGLVTVEKSQSTSTELKLVRGVKIDRGYISPYFVNNEEKSKCCLEDPFILIVSNKISSLTQILPVLEKIHQQNKPLLIIANDIEQEAIQNMITNVTKGLLQICAIKSPFYGEKRNQVLSDLAKALGTKVYNDLDEKEINDIKMSDLGTCKSIEIDNSSTLFVECKDIEDSEDKDLIENIQKQLDNKNLSKEEVAFLKQRLIINKGIVAVLSIGAHTESELLELVDRIDDALHATKAAIESGFLPGGGISLAKAGIDLLQSNTSKEDLLEKTVTKVISDACLSPLRQILVNADLPVDYIFEMIKNEPEWEYGYDVRNCCYTNMIDSGIIDPYKVTTTALKNAVSVACSLISVGCVVLSGNQNMQDVQLVQLSDNMY